MVLRRPSARSREGLNDERLLRRRYHSHRTRFLSARRAQRRRSWSICSSRTVTPSKSWACGSSCANASTRRPPIQARRASSSRSHRSPRRSIWCAVNSKRSRSARPRLWRPATERDTPEARAMDRLDPFEVTMLRGAALALRRRADRQSKIDEAGTMRGDRGVLIRTGEAVLGRSPFLGPRRSRRGL
jgi:hypothetical protein